MSALSCLVFRDLRPACAVEEGHVVRVSSPGEWNANGGGGAGAGGHARGEPLPIGVLGVSFGMGIGVMEPRDRGSCGGGSARVLELRTERGELALAVPGTLTFEQFDAERFAPLIGRAFAASFFSGVITRAESIDVFLLDPNRLIGSLAP